MDPNAQSVPAEQPVSAEIVPAAMAPPPRPPVRRSRLARLFAFMLTLLFLGFCLSILGGLLFIGSGGLGVSSELEEEAWSVDHFTSGKHKVAIISVTGTILNGDGFVKRQIDQVARDEDVKAVVLRIDSPGGTVTGSDFIYHHLCRLRDERELPIVVSMGSIAASGGYYISMAVGDTPKSIYAEPTTWTGSIGVMVPHYDASTLMKDWGIEEDTVVSHRLKNMGSFAKPMTDEERAIWQQLVDDSFARFKGIIRDGRPAFAEDPEALDELATGQVYTAQQAQASGLIDEIDFIEGAIDRAIELAGVDPDDVEVVQYKSELTLASILLGSQAPSRDSELSVVLEMATPRAYFLSSRVPPLVRDEE